MLYLYRFVAVWFQELLFYMFCLEEYKEDTKVPFVIV